VNTIKDGQDSNLGNDPSDASGKVPPEFAYLLPGWPAPANIHALTTTRWGGFSVGSTCSLNLGLNTSDPAERVMRNREQLRKNLNLPNEPAWLTQAHGVNLISLPPQLEDKVLEDKVSQDKVADGAITAEPREVCAILTADCLPLFLCDRFGEQLALIHVGWRGLAKGIVEKAVDKFFHPPTDLMAWAGPSISQVNFEVGPQVREQLGGPDDCYQASPTPGHWYADLYGLVGQRLHALGIKEYGWDDHCTYRDEHLFYSYRRDADCGRMVSLIWKTA
jgi:polyphenol oxidase